MFRGMRKFSRFFRKLSCYPPVVFRFNVFHSLQKKRWFEAIFCALDFKNWINMLFSFWKARGHLVIHYLYFYQWFLRIALMINSIEGFYGAIHSYVGYSMTSYCDGVEFLFACVLCVRISGSLFVRCLNVCLIGVVSGLCGISGIFAPVFK